MYWNSHLQESACQSFYACQITKLSCSQRELTVSFYPDLKEVNIIKIQSVFLVFVLFSRILYLAFRWWRSANTCMRQSRTEWRSVGRMEQKPFWTCKTFSSESWRNGTYRWLINYINNLACRCSRTDREWLRTCWNNCNWR